MVGTNRGHASIDYTISALESVQSHNVLCMRIRCRYSASLREYFDSFDDPLADRDASGDPIYRLESFDFPDTPIRNPIAFLRDRLMRDGGPNGVNDDEEARSAWLFLALTSIPH